MDKLAMRLSDAMCVEHPFSRCVEKTDGSAQCLQCVTESLKTTSGWYLIEDDAMTICHAHHKIFSSACITIRSRLFPILLPPVPP